MDRKIGVVVKNMPDIQISGYVVARLCYGELWYYGTYSEYSKAEEVVKEFENGIIVGYHEVSYNVMIKELKDKRYRVYRIFENKKDAYELAYSLNSMPDIKSKVIEINR